ncbi:MAG: tRNA (adenosine(37)-N6)-dimethylallyltransferase MiaA [Microbacter sp.]
MLEKTLLVLLGPTGVGKTALSLRLASMFHTAVISSDSRQCYREIPIGTAAPTLEALAGIPHYFVGTHSIFESYNAGRFELDVIRLLTDLFHENDVVLMVGGSMLYIDAVCSGIDDLPSVPNEIRRLVQEKYRTEGLESIRLWLKNIDIDYYRQVDLMNPQRIMHAIEISLLTGKPYSMLRTKTAKQRPFRIIKVGLNRPRTELYARIDQRVDEMMQLGLEEEARSLLPYKHLNALNTVGYKELFAYFEGKCSRQEAVDKIKQHSRNYAKKQLSWFNRDPEIQWFHPESEIEIISWIEQQISL